MADSSPLPTILTFAAIAVVAAAVASFLPVDRENSKIKAVGDLQFAYKDIKEPLAKPGEENVFDFLQFNLSRTVAEQSNKKIARLRTDQKATIAPLRFTHSSEEFVTVSENLAAVAHDDKQAALDELVTRKSALKSKDPNDCAAIENKYSSQNCRDEIYFQKAISSKNSEICAKIINQPLKSRCQSYVNLIPKHEVAN